MKLVKELFKKKPTYTEHAKVILLPVDKIEPSPFQARCVFDEIEIKKLAVSILQNGLLQPISVRQVKDGAWQLIAGERRLRACKLASFNEIPAIVYNYEDEQTATLGLLENLQREQLNPFEQARALRDLINMWNCTQEETAKRLGIAQSTLANKLRLLVISPQQEAMCLGAGLTERHARAILRIPTMEARTKALETIIQKQYNVQQTDEYVKQLLLKNNKPKNNIMISDERIFINTINRAIQMMTASGIPAHAKRCEQEDYVEYVVRIPTQGSKNGTANCNTVAKIIDVNEETLKSTQANLIKEIEKQVASISTGTAS